MSGLPLRPRRLALMIVVAALLGGAVALATGQRSRSPLPTGGSRFASDSGARKDVSLLDAFAPLLAVGSGRGVKQGGSGLTLSLARALGQLFLIGLRGTAPTQRALAQVRLHDWGGIVLRRSNFISPAQIAVLNRAVLAAALAAGHDAPMLIARQGGGDSSAFPGLAPASEPELGTVGRGDLVNGQAQLAARELRALHVDGTLAPVADLGDVAGPARDRAYSDDPPLVAALVRAAVTGYRQGGLLSVVGHFPGEGAASQDPSLGAATVGLALPTLLARDVEPFRAVVAVAPMIQMSDALYAAFDGVTRATLLPDAVALLRDRLGYRGVIVSGDLGAAAAATSGTIGQAAVAALQAGVDVLYLPDPAGAESAYNAVLTAVRDGQLNAAAIARSVARLLALKRGYDIGTASHT